MTTKNILGNKIDKIYKIKIFKQKLFEINPSLVLQYVQ